MILFARIVKGEAVAVHAFVVLRAGAVVPAAVKTVAIDTDPPLGALGVR